ncbi:MAG: S46 family peptidase [Flavobacteriales bacterium]
MKKLLAMLVMAFMMINSARPDEGMWVVHMLQRIYNADLNKMGLNLTPDEIYNINEASLKDAIVRLNGGMCTGEVISGQGLVLTNHHCAYDAIQGFSAPEHDYLTDGFFALALDQEMHIEDFEISFLRRIDDVTDRILADVTEGMSEDERSAAIGEARKALMEEMNPDGDKELELKSFYYGNEYYMFEYQTYMDVRLVAAPPESVGKYGGDTDNWMWPRHTGDFSMLRIYADADNNPAEFAENNVPYTPARHLNISLDGVQPGDFTMVMGYPGSTDRFLSSWGIRQALDLYNPAVVDVRDLKLKTMKSHMDADKGVRIQYAAKYAQTANYWKYYIGQSKGLKRLDVESKKEAIEMEFTKWVNHSEERIAKYGEALNLIESYYDETNHRVLSDVYAREAGLLGSDIALFAIRFARMAPGLLGENAEEVAELRETLIDMAEKFFDEYDQDTDRDLFVNMLGKYKADIAPEYWPSLFNTVDSKYKGSFAAYADKMYAKSVLVDRERCLEFINNPGQKVMDKDLAMTAGLSLLETYLSSMADPVQAKYDQGYRLFVAGLREMNPTKLYYPDANSTMRMTYGKVGPYDAADAVSYNYYTTANGILEKKDNSNPEFIVPDQLDELIRERDFGQWADSKSKELHVCFIHGTDITGGNSGSPVMDSNGDLIGLAFDGNWEAMSGDIAFESKLQRTISVDVRYIMWILDKYAGANNLIDEMDFVKGKRHVKGSSRVRDEKSPDNGKDPEAPSRIEEITGMTKEEIKSLSSEERKAIRERLKNQKN